MNFYDTLFPMFMFISGVALVFSFDKHLDSGTSKPQVLKKAGTRALALLLLGIVYNNKFSFDFANMRYYSVLGTIGFGYFISSVFYLYGGLKSRIIALLTILLGTWAMMAWIPVPGFGAGVFTPEGHFAGYLDRILNIGVMYREFYDPEGLMNMVSASTLTLAGTLVGTFLKHSKLNPSGKGMVLLGFGISMLLLSSLWNLIYPINKAMWTSSFSLAAISLSLIFLAGFYLVIDAWKIRFWTFPFVVIGLNSITAYMAERMIDFEYTSEFLLTGVMKLSGDFSGLVLATGVILLQWLLLFFLYKWKIFLKV
jgi:predicted acyltransferase